MACRETATSSAITQNAELAEVGAMYPSRAAIGDASLSALATASADVIHIAGHTERQPGLGESALLFRGGPVTWSRIATMRIGRPIVVLAACETLRAPASPDAHSLSLGAGFLAAGASAVIGTLTPVADNEARQIFRSVHRELARGRGAADALQRADLEAIAADSTAWWAVAVLTNTIDSGT